jgi:predicted transport protein
MNAVDKAMQTQLANIEKRSGKSLTELAKIIATSGLTKHGEIRDMLKSALKMGHGDANTLIHHVQQSAEPAESADDGDVLDAIYTGPKAGLRPIHDRLMKAIAGIGEFEIAPKKAYVSLRRKKQFATIGPATNTRVELGLNMKNVPATDRLLAMPEKSMCQYKIKISDPAEVDAELIAWIKKAFDSAG